MTVKELFMVILVVIVYLQLSTQKVIPVVNEEFEDCTVDGKIHMMDFSKLKFHNKDNESELHALIPEVP
jgi:hypothetical protein